MSGIAAVSALNPKEVWTPNLGVKAITKATLRDIRKAALTSNNRLLHKNMFDLSKLLKKFGRRVFALLPITAHLPSSTLSFSVISVGHYCNVSWHLEKA